MSYIEGMIGSAISTGRGIPPEKLSSGDIIDMSPRSLKNLPPEALLEMEKLGMINRNQMISLYLGKKEFAKVKITEEFQKRYKEYVTEEDKYVTDIYI